MSKLTGGQKSNTRTDPTIVSLNLISKGIGVNLSDILEHNFRSSRPPLINFVHGYNMQHIRTDPKYVIHLSWEGHLYFRVSH